MHKSADNVVTDIAYGAAIFGLVALAYFFGTVQGEYEGRTATEAECKARRGHVYGYMKSLGVCDYASAVLDHYKCKVTN